MTFLILLVHLDSDADIEASVCGLAMGGYCTVVRSCVIFAWVEGGMPVFAGTLVD